MNGEFQHNPAHAIGTCAQCGEEMTYNVPRLGPNGGYVHKATGSYECKTVAAPSADAPVEVRCSEWIDALAENVERKMNELYKGRCLDHDDVIVQRAVTIALGILVDALRSGHGKRIYRGK